MMMLHLAKRKIAFVCLRTCPLAEHVFRMQIASELGRLQMEELLVEVLRFEPVVERDNVLHITQMLRNERFFTARDRESVLEFGANC